MKVLGALLILLGAGSCCLLHRREGQLPLKIGRALLEDLSVLRCQICVQRMPLPQILDETLPKGLGAQWLWIPLSKRLERESGLPQCWAQAMEQLPDPLGRILSPLGQILPQGGERLGEAIEETREELSRFLRTETARQADKDRVTAAICFAGACMTILVLI